MAYLATNLVPLVVADSFTLWLYKTPDSRAAALSPGYFGPARAQLLPGHIVVLQAGDAASILPVRSGAEVGNGLVLDASSPPLRLARAVALGLDADLAAGAVARCVTLGAMPNGLRQGQSFTVQAAVSGATASLRFSVLNGAGATVLGPTTAAVASGAASATFQAPAAGNGYRLKVEDAADPLVTQTSPSFVVTIATAVAVLLLESGLGLLTETGSRLLL